MSSVRVRFAPSPTGYLHIGGARTALFNWLFAKKMKGTFILRIEDTDEVRSTEESVSAIIKSMRWLGLDWNEGPDDKNGDGKEFGSYGPYFQMQRKDKGIYQKYIDEMMAKGQAYPCYCTQEELDAMREEATKQKRVPKYDGRCRCLTAEQRKHKESEGRSAVIRYTMPNEGKTVVNDLIRGNVEFDNSMLDDFVLMKASGVPTYNFACVVDDHLMEMSHVIRGDDHLSNTPKQIHLYNALGWKLPELAHLSMILGPDGSRLSKRHGHTAVMEYRNEGYLPEALINYLTLLGWSTQDSQQLFELNDLIEKFSLERCSKNPATFDPQKLNWMNGEYMRKLTPDELIKRFYYWVSKNPQIQDLIGAWNKELLDKLIVMEQEKIKLFKDVPGLVDIFFVDSVEYNAEAKEKVLKKEGAKQVLEEALKRLEQQQDYSPEALEKFARDFAAEKGVGAGKVFHPLRVAVSGRTQGPSLFHMMELLGKEKVLKRINSCLSSCF